MIKKLFFVLLFVLFIFQFSLSQINQGSLYLKINLKFKNDLLELNKNYVSENDTLRISVMKFYISEIEIEYKDKTKFVLEKKHHLIDIEKPESLQIPICKKNDKAISSLNFNIGIDSLASVFGANAGDLDLQNGMYWAWQSGYINMKIEGKSKSCNTRKNEFQFHIGGYQKPNYAIRKINFNGNFNNNDTINVVVDLAQMFDTIDLKEKNQIMIPGKEVMKLADLSQNMFRLE